MYSVSVIIPIYNGERYLRNTLDSILASTQKDIQIVLVNDGSKDRSEEICLEYVARYMNVTYVYQENTGIAGARNKGLELVEGKYVCFCDQDDLVESEMYQKLYECIEYNACEMAICGTCRYIDGDVVNYEKFEDYVYTETQIFDGLIKPILLNGTDYGKTTNINWVGTIWKTMIKNELIKDKKLYFRRYLDYEDDLLFYINSLSHAKKVCTLSYVGYKWRVNRVSETYNWKYIDNYYDKYMNYMKDMIQMITLKCKDENIMDLYKQNQLCDMLQGYLINEGSSYNSKRYREKIKAIVRLLKREEIQEALKFRRHINKSSIKKIVALNLLSKGFVRLAYAWVISYKKTREIMLNFTLWFQIEEKIHNNYKRLKGEINNG